MSNLKTLKLPKKGEISNPKGKAPGTRNRATILKQISKVRVTIENPLTKEEETQPAEIMMNYALYAKALSGDVQTIKEINDTLYGKITEKTDVTTGGEKLNITFTRHEP